jgi:hypothetical protein
MHGRVNMRKHDLGNSHFKQTSYVRRFLIVMIYLLSLYEIMLYFIFVHNCIWILDKAFNIDFCLFNFVVVYYFLVHSLNSGAVRVKHDLIGCLYRFSVTSSIAIARLVFSSWRTMFVLKWEFPWSYMYAQVGLLVHALSILNFNKRQNTNYSFLPVTSKVS